MILLETFLGALLALLAAIGLATALGQFSTAMECRHDALQAALRIRALATQELPARAGRTPTHTWVEWPCPGGTSVRINLPHLEPETERTLK